MPARARWSLPAGLLVALLAMPGAASAANADKVAGGVLEITAGGGEVNSMTVALTGDGYTIADSAGMTDSDPECGPDQSDPNAVDCTTAGVTSLRIVLGDGNDGVTLNLATPVTMIGGTGNDTLLGGSGPDTLIAENAAGDTSTGSNVLEGRGGDDVMEGGGGGDSMDGGDGNDQVDAGGGNDTVLGQAGDDELDPGPGPQGGSSDSDQMAGGEGFDEVSFAARATAVNVSLDSQPNDGVPGEGDNVQGDVEQVTGGSAADTLGGSAAGNRLNGGPGADQMNGNGGDDALDGGGDADVADGGDGNDSVSGGAGADAVSGGAGDDFVDGSVAPLVGADGNDQVAGGAGNDVLGGGDGDDELDGGEGSDSMGGGLGTDTADYENAAAAASAGAGAGGLTGAGLGAPSIRVSLDGTANDGLAKEGDNVQPDVENVKSGGGDDTVSGSPGTNGLTSGTGEDYLDGRDGEDVMSAGASRDVMQARDGFLDSVDCGAGVDFAIVDRRETATQSCEFLDKGGPRRPRLGRRVVLRPLRGGRRLGFGSPGMDRYVPLADTLLLPVRSSVRARGGAAVRLTSAAAGGARQSAVLSGGAFLVKQGRRARGLTQLNLRGGDFGACAAGAGRGKASAAGSRRRVRRLFGRGRGRFRTRGRNSAATVRGTRWVVIDRCDGTLTRVRRGTVRVRDFGLRRTVTVRAGESYLAKDR
jgi:Ca2+-binding RTX toxin-like protein